MRKISVLGALAIAASLGLSACNQKADPRVAIAADRAEIEQLQTSYMFAMDWRDADAYAATFAPDGVLDYAGGVITGREAITAEIHKMAERDAQRTAEDKSGLRPVRMRHFISNVVLKFDGDKATGVAYWMSATNGNAERTPFINGYGHYEDELVKVDGKWLFARRKIYNEALANRTASTTRPGS